MVEDSILQEVRAAREEYAASHEFDVRRIVADLQQMDAKDSWTVVRLAPRPPKFRSQTPGQVTKPNGAAASGPSVETCKTG